MTTMRCVWAAGFVVAAAALFAACGGDGGGNETATAPAGEPGASSELVALAERFAASSFRGEYTVTGLADSAEFQDARLVIYKDGADKVRFDLSATQDGEPTELLFFETAEMSAFCLRNAGEFGLLLGINEGDGVCFNDEAGGGAGDYSEIIQDIEQGDGEILERSQRQIAGQQADCYQVSDAQGSISDVCFSAEGYLLATTEADGSGLEATSVSGSVSEGDFTLPYEVREFPDTSTQE